MPNVLITAFEPYDHWKSNASWLALVALTKELPQVPAVTTRLYPVDFATARDKLAEDLAADYDYALHLGQAPGSGSVRLESIAINVGGRGDRLIEDGPVAYQSDLPLAEWSAKLRDDGIPAQVSYHAGTYLCNGALYFSHYFAEQMGLKTRSTFIHLPLDATQASEERKDVASMPATLLARAIRLILEELVV